MIQQTDRFDSRLVRWELGYPKTNSDAFFAALNSYFPIKKSEMDFFLGMRVVRDRRNRTLRLDQSHVIPTLHKIHNIPSQKITTPMLPSLVLPV